MLAIITQIAKKPNPSDEEVIKILFKNPIKGIGIISKSKLLDEFNTLKAQGALKLSSKEQQNFLNAIQMRKVRTISGVSPVTIMTKPYPCPGKCIYCPNDPAVPKSYISNEPGAQRAISNKFDPYLQTYNRLVALQNIGHPTNKVEVIVIGGTWSFYPLNYRIWFIKRCFDALNDFSPDKKSLIKKNSHLFIEIPWENIMKAQKKNETAHARCVGLSVETRPDWISVSELITMRKLGITKVQIGIQSLKDQVLKINKRGHRVKSTAKAIGLLRMLGFKIQAHWMPNLLGSCPKGDTKEYTQLFTDENFKPDEIKIYPCSLISQTMLEKYYQKGLWKPYNTKDLIRLIKHCLLVTPRYCRISRIIRDISSTDILVGNRMSNLRQVVENEIPKSKKIKEVRFREVRGLQIALSDLKMKSTSYLTFVSKEMFIEMVDKNDRLAGFLRLSLPVKQSPISELKNSALIREIHVYGASLGLGDSQEGKPQHMGIGKLLIEKALNLGRANKYRRVSVISSVGTKEYYRNNGFYDGTLYQHYDFRTLETAQHTYR